jgi:hypothetical protein
MGYGGWAQSQIPNPQSPIPNPHYFILLIFNVKKISLNNNIKYFIIYRKHKK